MKSTGWKQNQPLFLKGFGASSTGEEQNTCPFGLLGGPPKHLPVRSKSKPAVMLVLLMDLPVRSNLTTEVVPAGCLWLGRPRPMGLHRSTASPSRPVLALRAP